VDVLEELEATVAVRGLQHGDERLAVGLRLPTGFHPALAAAVAGFIAP
jgi:hypothetical protein